jgi:hypothetical protein
MTGDLSEGNLHNDNQLDNSRKGDSAYTGREYEKYLEPRDRGL